MKKVISEIKSLVKTVFFFGWACLLVPVFIFSFIFVHYNNELWNYILAVKYPSLQISKSKKIRTLIDTPRNAGVFHFLLQLQGPCDFEKIKENYITHLTEKKNKSGELRFPKLRQKLVTCWGHYAWVKDSSNFNIDNHVVLSSKPSFRGRLVNETNIQDFVSELVTKYIPSDIPQWQVIVIPSSSGSASQSESDMVMSDTFYVLVKIHHLLIAEESNLHISEILMLNSPENGAFQLVSSDNIVEPPKLSNLVEPPVHILNLWNHILMVIINRWNEFIYHYDSLDSPDVDKKQQITCISQLVSLLIITVVTVILDFVKGYSKTKNQLKYKLKFLLVLIRHEVNKRNLSWEAVGNSIVISLNPVNLAKNLLRFLFLFNVNQILMTPFYVFCEMAALKDLVLSGHTKYTSTFIGIISVYVPLVLYAQIEFFKICKDIVLAPRYIFEELFEHRSNEPNILQVKSYSGRKVVSFSKSIDMRQVRERLKTSSSESEFTIACMAGALKKYFDGFEGHSVPDYLNTTCRAISKNYFLQKYDKKNNIGGVVFFQLPMSEPSLAQLEDIRSIVERIRRKQMLIYLVSKWQTQFEILTATVPTVLMKICINYFSFNFPVTITELHGDSSKLETIWGQEVSDLLFFRPPQSKTCLSLNLHRFGDKSRLAVMADTQLAPEHSKIPIFWENYMENALLY